MTSKRDPSRCPTHPGQLLRQVVFPALKLSPRQIASQLGVTLYSLNKVLSERGPVTVDLALRLGAAFGNTPDVWLNMQRNYDLWQSRRKLGTALKCIPALTDAELAAAAKNGELVLVSGPAW